MVVKIKICGLSNEADALQAAQLGADAIGLNFYAGSPRYIQEETAEAIMRALPALVEPVGLFVNEPFERVQAVMTRLGLRTFQTHGKSQEIMRPGALRHIPAFSVRDQGSLLDITTYLELCRGLASVPAAILVDAHVPGLHGGTGQTAPWDLLADFQPGVPLILAGGLTPDNVAQAVRRVRPYAVDVASVVESSPGRKNVEKMRRFIEEARRV